MHYLNKYSLSCLKKRFSLELEDVFLLLVVQRHLADGVLQGDGDLAVVGNPLTGALLILVEAHLLLVDHTVHVVPRPAGTQTDRRSGF